MNLSIVKKLVGVALFSSVAMIFAGCGTAPGTETGKADLTDEAQTAVNKFERTDPGMADFLGKAYGYAIFPNVGEGGFGVGGSYGRGVVYEQGRKVGYCDITQASIGFQLLRAARLPDQGSARAVQEQHLLLLR
jgi:lipid-binding SYLF domain-containing protein